MDEDLPRSIAEMFRAADYDASTVPEQGLAGYADARLWPIIQAERRVLFTADVGVADVRARNTDDHAGVVLLRLAHETRDGYRKLAERLLASKYFAEISGATTVVTESRIRIRKRNSPRA